MTPDANPAESDDAIGGPSSGQTLLATGRPRTARDLRPPASTPQQPTSSKQSTTSPITRHPRTSAFVGAHLATAGRSPQRGNWRLFVVHLLSSGLAVTITVLVLPGFWYEQWVWNELLLVALVAGVLNATVKPLLQFFALRYLIASYGAVVVLVNAAVLFLLAVILHGDIVFRGVFALLIGGVVVGILGMVFDAVLGTGAPILDQATDPTTEAEAQHSSRHRRRTG